MNWYEDNNNWALDAVNEALKLVEKKASSTINLNKNAATVTVNPLMLLTGIAGAALSGKAIAANKEQQYKQLYGNAVAKIVNEANKKLADMSSDYYSSIANIDRDLKIMFTPMSVVYMLRGTVIDTVSVDTMTAAMKTAWRSKDNAYFKNMLLNKIQLEAQNAEQMFISRLIDYDKAMKQRIKKASEHADDDFDFIAEDHSPLEMIDKFAALSKVVEASSKSPLIDKFAGDILKYLGKLEHEEIPIELGALKMAEETDLDLGLAKLAFLWFGKKDNQITINDMKKDLSISYLPDRVLFISNDMVVSQLSTFEMNEEAYAHFAKKNSNYFRKLFFSMAKNAGYDVGDLEKLGEDDSNDDSEYEKHRELDAIMEEIAPHAIAEGFIMPEKSAAAALDTVDQLMTLDNIHPKVYYLFMMKHFGERWLSWDMETLENMLRDNLGVADIGEIPMNKLMCISLLFNGDAAYTGYHTFEKIVRTFNNKSIDFELRESNLSLGEFVNAIRTMGDIISDTDDNIYDNFSDHVFSYLVEVLADQNYRTCAHKMTSGNEAAFWKLVNFELFEYWTKRLPNGLFNRVGQGKVENKTVQKVTEAVTDKFRNTKDVSKLHEEIDIACRASGLTESAYIDIIARDVLNALAVDKFIPYVNSIRDEQIKQYV